ncbi:MULTISPECIES: acetyltransferase [unclassified Microcoleus]|uniref:acetyltransferase n=1 Tax=unclassified Microcoleus TaxID=2642155 RepID=UPI002FCF52C7
MSANLEAETSTPEDIQEVIAELEQYRQRLIDDTLEMAKKVKMPKQAVMKQLENHPEIVYIDGALANLRSQPQDNNTAVETA